MAIFRSWRCLANFSRDKERGSANGRWSYFKTGSCRETGQNSGQAKQSAGPKTRISSKSVVTPRQMLKRKRKLDQKISHVSICSTWLELGLNSTPKLHFLGFHVVPFLKRWRNPAVFSEQAIEALHQRFKKLDQIFQSQRDTTKKFVSMIDRHHSSIWCVCCYSQKIKHPKKIYSLKKVKKWGSKMITKV